MLTRTHSDTACYTYSDLVVEIEGREFKLHAAVMANASKYFSDTLANPYFCAMKREGKYFLKFDSRQYKDVVKCAAFVMVVEFVYSGRLIECEEETILMTGWTDEDGPFMSLECYILKIADFFQMDSMVSVYTTLFYRRLTPKTVIDKLLIVCKIPGLRAARQAAIDYIVENVDVVKVDLVAVRERAVCCGVVLTAWCAGARPRRLEWYAEVETVDPLRDHRSTHGDRERTGHVPRGIWSGVPCSQF